ncbi:MAG TPA: 50S ribosomal protein L11 methyltransferase [Chitinophagaceae bacterium]|nr:50S ribosomal protein L11 methyltransferase [Chitinophagales bacterium]HPG11139.1 50S ribosomal protein L11 methyltransferase [Chitinophagaceae bacterium]
MSNYIQIQFSELQPEQTELLIAQLAEAGYDGFEEIDSGLKAFVSKESFDKQFLHDLVYKYQLSYSEQEIEEQNWNAVWESNFQPVLVDDKVCIRADFHEPAVNAKMEIIITPKMSFGTGHHATTYMMVSQMFDLDFVGKKVFDFGTGTGVLAILAEKLGAAYTIAVDNDEWSIQNAAENITRNDCSKIIIEQGDKISGGSYDILLANINKNVILDNMAEMKKSTSPKGMILLSGLLQEDEPEILVAAEGLALKPVSKMQKDNWICIGLR